MDIDEIRRQNIKTIEREVGGATELSSRVGMSYSQYVNLRDGAPDSKTGKPRGMRKQTAWKFEDAGGKPRGWLDRPVDAFPSPSAPALTDEQRALLADWILLRPEDQKRIRDEIVKLADAARYYRTFFGDKTADPERVNQALPPAPSLPAPSLPAPAKSPKQRKEKQ